MSRRESYDHGVFSWVDLASHEIGGAMEFYGSLMGWTALSQDTQGGPPYVMFELEGDSVAGLGQVDDAGKANGQPATWNTYITVDDADETHAKALALGATAITPVMDVMEVGRMAFLTDPAGATFAIWQAKLHAGAQRVNEPGTFCWSELYTRDADAAQSFYSQLFGWTYETMEAAEDQYFLIQQGGKPIGGFLVLDDAWEGPAECWAVYFNTANLDEQLAKVEPLGGTILKPKFDTPVGPCAVIADRDMAAFSLIQLHQYD